MPGSKLTVVALLVLPAIVMAAPAFDIHGLYVGLAFEDAVARAEALGGSCERREVEQGAVIVAECNYPQLAGEQGDQRLPSHPRFAIAAQPVVRVGLEAPDATAGLTRIAFKFAGDAHPVEEALRDQYGRPANDTAENVERSWSNAHRVSWQQGRDNLGLLRTANTIILSRNPGAESTRPAAADDDS